MQKQPQEAIQKQPQEAIQKQPQEAMQKQPQEDILQDNSQERIIFNFQLALVKSGIRFVVLAPPGTGKTTTNARIIKFFIGDKEILKCKELFKQFLFLSFNKKTVRDLIYKIMDEKKRSQQVQQAEKKMLHKSIRTFHSLASTICRPKEIIEKGQIKKLLKDYCQQKYDDQKIDKQQKKKILKKVWSRIQLIQSQNKSFQAQIIKMRQKAQTIKLADILQFYYNTMQELLKKERKTSYGYLLVKIVEKLKDKNFKFEFLNKIKLMIVDEFQDTNPTQLEILRQIIKRIPDVNLLMVGDIDQNIYSWRGAKIQSIRQFINQHKLFSDSLSNTYRLNNKMVEASQKFIKEGNDIYSQARKVLLKELQLTDSYNVVSRNIKNEVEPKVETYQSETTQVRSIVQRIIDHSEVLKEKGIKFGRIAILLRSLKNSKNFLEKLKIQIGSRQKQIEKKIPFTIVRNKQMFKNTEVKFIISMVNYCFFTIKQQKKGMLKQDIINIMTSIKGVGKDSPCLKRILELKSINILCLGKISDHVRQFFKKFNKLLNEFSKLRNPVELCLYITRNFLCQEFSKLEYSEQLGQFQDWVENYEKDEQEESDSDSNLQKNKKIEEVEYVFVRMAKKIQKDSSKFQKERDNFKIQIQTSHQSKGLEYDMVFIPSLNQKYQSFEDKRTSNNSSQISQYQFQKICQQHRLVYVTLTRTTQFCFISQSKSVYQEESQQIKLSHNPQFEALKKICGSSQIPRDQEKDEELQKTHLQSKTKKK